MLQRAKSFIVRPKPPPDIYDQGDASHLRRPTRVASNENLQPPPAPDKKPVRKNRSLSFRVRRKKTECNSK